MDPCYSVVVSEIQCTVREAFKLFFLWENMLELNYDMEHIERESWNCHILFYHKLQIPKCPLI